MEYHDVGKRGRGRNRGVGEMAAGVLECYGRRSGRLNGFYIRLLY
jgi:hypothetical protein